jgi:DNA-binding transcriptional MerR regulator
MSNENFVRLSELARELDINKSKLNYYGSLGLLPTPFMQGKIATYKREELIERLKSIKVWRRHGKELPEIKKLLDHANN